jgi:adenylate cyclase
MQDVDTLAESPSARAHEGYRLSLESEPRRIRAEFRGETIADSGAVLVMHETRLAPVFYFPRGDVRMDLLAKSDRTTHCPFKGNASYWTIRVGEHSVENAAWSYETPYDESSSVEKYIAFDWQAIDRWYADDTVIAEQPRDEAVAKDNPLVNWLVRDAWMSKTSRDLVMRFSDAMIAAGLPLWRIRLLVRTANPLLFAIVYMWQRGAEEVTSFEVSHEGLQSERYRNSPFAMVINGEGGVRRRLEGPNVRLDFPVLEDLVAEGGTDYVAMPLRFSDGQLNILTMVSDRAGGFSTEALGQIYEILPTLSRLFESHALRLSSSTLLRTYLGSDAGQRVMDGLVKRGDGEDIHAAIWITDLRESTSLAASLSREDYLSLLNRYFDSVAGAVLDHGGEVLKFIGDSVLAIFAIDDPDQKEPEACARALAAAAEASRKFAAVNEERAADGAPALGFGIGLHRGDLTYGNVGTTKRLDFTVIGSAVNEASRIEGLSKTLNRQILISAAFRESVPDPLISLGHHSLRGVTGECEIFGLPIT